MTKYLIIPWILEFKNGLTISISLYYLCNIQNLSIFFFFFCSLDPIKSFEAPATINSASLHPEKEFLVAGGEDFKLYKYDYNSGEELGELSFFFL